LTAEENFTEFSRSEPLIELVQDVPMELFISLAATIHCGLGISAFDWSTQKLAPVMVMCGNKSVLALAPNPVVERDHKFYLVEGPEPLQRITLLARDPREELRYFTVCLFPPEVKVDVMGILESTF